MKAGDAVLRFAEPVTLACGHIMYVRPSHVPQPGVLLWCGRCKSDTHLPFPMRKDVDGKPVPGDWYWKCLRGSNCNGGQHGHGSSMTNAQYAAARHSRKYPTHEIWLISPRGIVTDRWGPDSYGAPEPLWRTSAGVVMWTPKEGKGGERSAGKGSQTPDGTG